MKTKKKPGKNVFLRKRNGVPYRWWGRYSLNGFKFYVGCFKTEAEAIEAVAKHKAKQTAKIALKGSQTPVAYR
jgi:hypothetical protein